MKKALWRHSLGVAFASSCLLLIYSCLHTDFDRRFPGFVEQNELMLRRASTYRPGRVRDTILQTVRRNLRWAKRFRETGVDPDFFNGCDNEPRSVEEGNITECSAGTSSNGN